MALQITEVSPSTIVELSDSWVHVLGSGFLGGVTWFLSTDQGRSFSIGTVTIEGDTDAALLIPALPPGIYGIKAQTDTEEFSLAKALTIVASSTDELYNYLIGPIREDDRLEGREFLQRYMSAPQALVDQMRDKVFSLPFSLGAYSLDADLLPQLAKLVAFGEPELSPILNGLSVAGQRKLIASATTLWAQQATEPGYRNACRIVSGKEVAIFNWFAYRSLCADADNCFIGFSRRSGGGLKLWPDAYVYPDKLGTAPPVIIGNPGPQQSQTFDPDLYYFENEQSGPFQSDIILHFPFATNEEMDIVYHILRLMRPLNERLYVYFDEVFEDWRYGLRSPEFWYAYPGAVEDMEDGWIRIHSPTTGADAAIMLGDSPTTTDKGLWRLLTRMGPMTFVSTVKLSLPPLALDGFGNPQAREYVNMIFQQGTPLELDKGAYSIRFHKTNTSGRLAHVALMRQMPDETKIIIATTTFPMTAGKEYTVQLDLEYVNIGIVDAWVLQVYIDGEFVLKGTHSVNSVFFDPNGDWTYFVPLFIEPSGTVDVSSYNSYVSTVDAFKRERSMRKVGINT